LNHAHAAAINQARLSDVNHYPDKEHQVQSLRRLTVSKLSAANRRGTDVVGSVADLFASSLSVRQKSRTLDTVAGEKTIKILVRLHRRQG
jgi:hypothetical protein